MDVLDELSEDQQYELYKKLRAKFSILKNDEEVYYVFNSGYTSRLLKNSREPSTTLKDKVIKVFEERDFDERPVFIYDNTWGQGLYLRDGDNYNNLGSNMDAIKEKVSSELFSIIAKKRDCVCFKRTETQPLMDMMKEMNYCRIFSIDSIRYEFTENGTTIVIEDVDSESG